MWGVLISPLYVSAHCSGRGKQSPDEPSGSQWKRILGIQRFSPGRPNQSFLFCFLWNKTSAYCFYKSIRSVISSWKSGAPPNFGTKLDRREERCSNYGDEFRYRSLKSEKFHLNVNLLEPCSTFSETSISSWTEGNVSPSILFSSTGDWCEY